MKEIFTDIIENNKWWAHEQTPSEESKQTLCGPGSTLRYTQGLRESLPVLFEKLNIKSMFDAPCGDFVWMTHVNFPENFFYSGGDIVDMLIENNKKKYDEKFKFQVFDITTDRIPNVDLFFCRDCLFHLSYESINKVLQNFINSGSKFFATSNHSFAENGPDISNGQWKLINFLNSPYNFSKPVYSIKDYVPNGIDLDRYLLVWDRESVVNSFNNMLNK